MKLDSGRWLLLVALFGCLGLGILLLTAHWGAAIRISNYLFFVLLSTVIYEITFFKK